MFNSDWIKTNNFSYVLLHLRLNVTSLLSGTSLRETITIIPAILTQLLVAASVDMNGLGGYPMLTHSSYTKVDMGMPKVSN
jgi:hypothetical protein